MMPALLFMIILPGARRGSHSAPRWTPWRRPGVGSLWLPEMIYRSLADPFIGMARALARKPRLKVGTG